MARYTVTLVFEAGGGAAPVGAGVLDGLELPDGAGYRSSFCDGRALTVVVDVRSARPAVICRHVVESVQQAWADATRMPVGAPVSVRVRPLRPPQPVAEGVARPREYVWRPDAEGDGRLVLVDAGSDPISRPNGPEGSRGPDDPGGELAAVREQRRPKPGLGPMRIRLPVLPRRGADG